jgi:SOS response regulatory protein OraA/RecX
MVNMTLAIPKEIHDKMKQHKEIKWTEIARQAVEKKLKELQVEDKAWKEHGQKHAVERGWSEAHELFKF